MKHGRIGKRIASLLLVAVMLLSYVPVRTWAVDSPTDIKAIEKPTGMVIVEDYDDYFGDGWEEKLGLPVSVNVTLADNSAVAAPVSWDLSVLDTRETGYYYLPGTVTLPAGATNGQNLEVTITIQVREKVNLFTNGSFEDGKAGWSIGSSALNNGTPAAEGKCALQVRSSSSNSSSNNMLFPTTASATELATKMAAEGAGQYYIGAQVRDYIYDHATDDTKDEIQHTDALRVCMRMGYKNDAADSISYYGYSADVTISDEEYRTAGGVFELTGEEVALSPRLYLKSATKFKAQWILVDDFQFNPLKVALKAEPSGVAEIKTEIPSRFVAVDYDKYVGDDWQTALGLPEKVDILTDKGDTIAVDGTPNQVAFNRRYMPMVRRFKQLRQGRDDLFWQYDFYRSNRHDADFSTTSIHGIDTVSFLAGKSYRHIDFRYYPNPIDSTLIPIITLDFELMDGAKGRITFNPGSGICAERCTMHGTNEMIYAALPYHGINGSMDGPGSIVVTEKNQIILREEAPEEEFFISNGFYGENAHFFDCIRSGIRPEGDIASGLQAVEIAECIRNRMSSYDADL